MVNSTLKIILITIGSILLAYILYFVYLSLNWPGNPTDAEQEAQWKFEQRCQFDSLGQMTIKETRFSDSMTINGFEYAKIERVYHFWRCRGRNELTQEHFYLKYKRKKPVLKSFEAKSEAYLREITAHAFTNYISDSDIMKYETFNIQDDFFGKRQSFYRDTIFKMCGVKIVKDGNNKWRRVKY